MRTVHFYRLLFSLDQAMKSLSCVLWLGSAKTRIKGLKIFVPNFTALLIRVGEADKAYQG